MRPSDTLQISTPSDREILMTRSFDAPKARVYAAYTEPDLLKRWFGVFKDWRLEVCELDLRVGGRLRYEWRNGRGTFMGLTCVVREVMPSERLVNTETFDDPWYEGEALTTVTFEEAEGRTTLRLLARYDTKAIRDAVLRSGMETGLEASFDQLAQVLAMEARKA